MIILPEEDNASMCPIDIIQRIIEFIGSLTGRAVTTVQYPVQCGICGEKTKGNIVIGYRMGCKEEH